jgi:hypothetical protein
VTLQSARPCERGINRSPREATLAVAIAGTRAAWLRTAGGNTLETIVLTATLARPKPVWVAFASAEDELHGQFVGAPSGDGQLLVFNTSHRCRALNPEFPPLTPCASGVADAEIDQATVWRLPATRGRVACPEPSRRVRICAQVARASEELTVLAADSGRIAVRHRSGAIELLRATGELLTRFPAGPPARVVLQGAQLAVQRGTSLEVYDTRSGALIEEHALQGTAPRLQDLQAGIAIYVANARVRALRLSDGKDVVIVRGGVAQIEAPGVFAALKRQVTFVPKALVLKKLG